jgi:antitoxin component of MazEF toxin-antitoxin module
MRKGEQFLRTIRKSGTSFSVNIPPEIIRILNLKEGDIIRINLEPVKIKR